MNNQLHLENMSSLIFKIPQALNSSLNEFHFVMEAFCDSIRFTKITLSSGIIFPSAKSLSQ